MIDGRMSAVVTGLGKEAGEPKEFWYEPSIGHVMFEAKFPEEYEKRVIGFLDKYLSTN